MEQSEYESLNNHNNDYWRKKKRMPWSVPVAIIAVLALAGVSTWGYYQNKQLGDLRVLMENQYSRAFIDLADYVDNVEVLLAKSMVTSTPKSTSVILEEVWREANLAQTNMGQLPVAPPILEKTSNFLTQVGDMAFALNNKTMNGQDLSDKEYDAIQKLHGFAISLQNSLHGIENQINSGKMAWGSAGGPRNLSTRNTVDTQTSQFENIEKNFQEYPSLVYDGPYSDHMMKVKPVGLKNQKVDAGKAGEIVRKVFGNDKIKDIQQLDSNKESSIKTFRFKVIFNSSSKEEDSAQIDITQQGGQIYWMLRDRNVSDGKISMDAAKKAASNFLAKNGFSNMKDTYYMKVDGVATICYAYSQSDVIVYPDLIKVKVALDNGEVLGVEAKGYLYNHKKRDIPQAKITVEQAKALINNRLSIESESKAIIPTDFKTEKYCYQFQGKIGDQKFIIYISALTGEEEDVLLLMDTEDGTMTM